MAEISNPTTQKNCSGFAKQSPQTLVVTFGKQLPTAGLAANQVALPVPEMQSTLMVGIRWKGLTPN